MPSRGFFSELRRRNVFRVAIAYLVLGWLLIQVADVMFPALNLPEWSITFVIALLIIGFIPTLMFSWVYELTPEGLKRESEVDRAHSITAETGRRLDIITIGLLIVGISLVLVDNFVLDQAGPIPAPTPVETTLSGLPPSSLARDDAISILAVLPFHAAGSDDGGFLASGLHNDLITRLARLEAFKVIARSSMMDYAETTKNAREIGDELGAGYLLEGTVQALAGRVRINAQLIDAEAETHLWASSYDRELTAANLFDIQAEVAVAIAGQLQATLSDADRSLIDEVPTQSTEAYKAYLRGLEQWHTEGWNTSKQERVVAAFEEAVRLDPAFALAWARLSAVHSRLAIWGDVATREAALAALVKARALNPDLLETELAWVTYLYYVLMEFKQALESLEAIGERGALDADSLELKGLLYRRLGRFQDAYLTLLEAQGLKPRSIGIAIALVWTAIMNDDCKAAEQHTQAALSLAPDSGDVREIAARFELECTGNAKHASELLSGVEFTTGFQLEAARAAAFADRDYHRLYELSNIAWKSPNPLGPVFDQLDRHHALRYLGRDEEAAATLDEMGETLAALEQEHGHDRSGAYMLASYTRMKAWYHALRGDVKLTRHWMEENKRVGAKKFKDDRLNKSLNHHNNAEILAYVGLYEEAIEELRVMFEEPGGSGFQFVDASPLLDALKDHPDYIALRERYGDAR